MDKTSTVSPEAKACAEKYVTKLSSLYGMQPVTYHRLVDVLSASVQDLLSSHESKVRREYEEWIKHWEDESKVLRTTGKPGEWDLGRANGFDSCVMDMKRRAFKMSMDKIAAEAAKKLADMLAGMFVGGPNPDIYEDFIKESSAVIQSALSQSLAARDKEIEELAARWDSDAEVREASDAKQWARNFRVDTRVLRDCAIELRALLNGKAI